MVPVLLKIFQSQVGRGFCEMWQDLRFLKVHKPVFKSRQLPANKIGKSKASEGRDVVEIGVIPLDCWPKLLWPSWPQQVSISAGFPGAGEHISCVFFLQELRRSVSSRQCSRSLWRLCLWENTIMGKLLGDSQRKTVENAVLPSGFLKELYGGYLGTKKTCWGGSQLWGLRSTALLVLVTAVHCVCSGKSVISSGVE